MEQNQVSSGNNSWFVELLSDPAVAAAHYLASLLEEPVRNESGCDEDHSYVAGLVCWNVVIDLFLLSKEMIIEQYPKKDHQWWSFLICVKTITIKSYFRFATIITFVLSTLS